MLAGTVISSADSYIAHIPLKKPNNFFEMPGLISD